MKPPWLHGKKLYTGDAEVTFLRWGVIRETKEQEYQRKLKGERKALPDPPAWVRFPDGHLEAMPWTSLRG